MRARIIFVSAICVIPIALSACGGSDTGSARAKSIEDLQTSLTEQDWPQTVIDCQKDLVAAMSDDDFTSINEGTASDELQAKRTADVAACFALDVKGKGGGKGG